MKIGNYKGVKYALTFSKEKFDTVVAFSLAHWKIMAGGLLVLVLLLALTGCSIGRDDAPVTPSQTTVTAMCPSIIEGTVDAPPMADRVSALAIEAQSKGIALTGDYPTDVAKQGGEMMLIGTNFMFVFDAGCQIDKSQSRLNLFLTDYPVEGGMEANGTLGMAVDVGGAKVAIKGRVVNGQFIEGEVRKGWLPHIYGILNGGYRKL